MQQESKKKVSRRDFLKTVGIVAGGAAAAGVLNACSSTTTTVTNSTTATNTTTVSGTTTLTSPVTTTVTSTTPVTTTVTAPPTTAPPAPDAFMFFNTDQAAAVKAIVGRIIPGTASDPGAVEAKAYIFIDRALNGYLANKSIAKGVPEPTAQNAYINGLIALDAYSQSKYNDIFANLNSTQQDAILTDMQAGNTGGAFYAPSDQQFFNLLLKHTQQGTYCDPLYGGNYNLVGWKMLGFPGAQVSYSDTQMAIGFDQSTIPIMTLADSEKIFEPLPGGPSAGF